jgi:hypothetical protein
MAIQSRQVTLSNVVATRIVGHDNMPHRAALHNATKSSNEYVWVAEGSAAAFSTASGFHIDPGQTIYIDLAAEDELWATSTPNGLIVHVIDMRQND